MYKVKKRKENLLTTSNNQLTNQINSWKAFQETDK